MSEALKIAALKAQEKSLALGFILTFLVGFFGMFYVSIKAGVVSAIIALVLIILSILSAGLLAFLFIFYWIGLLIYTVVAINAHNKRLYSQAMAAESRAAAKN